MNITSIPASLILLVFTAILCIYIYRNDKVEKEPLSLLTILFVAGMISFAITAYLEQLLVGGVDKLFMPYFNVDGEGTVIYVSESTRIAHVLACAVLLAVIEEVVRGLILCLITHKNKNFNYTFDGVVYATILYLGFGLIEAFRYVQSGGFGSVILRAICCIPAHLFWGVLMGCFYTRWHVRTVEKSKQKSGKTFAVPYYVILPIIVHTIYTFLNMKAIMMGRYIYEIIMLLLCILTLLLIRRMASRDTMIAMVLCAVLIISSITSTNLQADQKKKNAGFYYTQLDKGGKAIYKAMQTDIANGSLNSNVSLPDKDITWEMIRKAAQAFHFENPKYYWLRGASVGGYITRSETNPTCNLTYGTFSFWDQTLDKKAARQKLNKVVKKIAKEAKKRKNKIDQVQYVHDYIINNCIYDTPTLNRCKMTIHDPFDELIYSAYGCLVNKRAVCAGYAQAFELILKELGIPCTYVLGFGGDFKTGYHAWNSVTLGGERYWVDTTWDDTNRGDKHSDVIYTYFMMTSNAMKIDHKAEDYNAHLKSPTATGKKFNYYRYNGYYMEEYSESRLNRIVSKQSDKYKKEVRCSKDAYKKALKAIKNGKFRMYDFNRFWYWWNDKYYILSFSKY